MSIRYVLRKSPSVRVFQMSPGLPTSKLRHVRPLGEMMSDE